VAAVGSNAAGSPEGVSLAGASELHHRDYTKNTKRSFFIKKIGLLSS